MTSPPEPTDPAEALRQHAARLDLCLPDACIAGVLANLAVLRDHAALLDDGPPADADA